MADGEGSVTRLIDGLKVGDPEAARRLWDRYFADLVRLAGARLRNQPRAAVDEEDAALSAFDSLCRGTGAGRFPGLDDREGLWRLLATITARKAADQVEREHRLKRGGGHVRAEADMAAAALEAGGLGQVPDGGPSPEMAAIFADEYARLFDRLPDDAMRTVARLKLEGYSDREVATAQGCSLRSIERRLKMIRALWSEADRDGH